MTPSPFTLREWASPERLFIFAAVTTAIAVLTAIIGPFGTFTDMSMADRFLYWFIIIWLNGGQIFIVLASLMQLPRLAELPGIVPAAVACAVAALPATFEVFWLEGLFRPEISDLPPFWQIYGYVLVLSLVIVLPFAFFLDRRGKQGNGDRSEIGTAAMMAGASTPLFGRLPDRLGTDILCLCAEDHYLRVYTELGDDLVLYRLSDAINELSAIDGRQVHRSWWVARSSVVETDRDGRKVMLILKNGVRVPVSRGHLPDLRRDGWL